MIIESIIGLVVGAVVYLSWKVIKSYGSNTDLNQDGKTDIKDAAVVVEKVAEKVEKAADVNNDGKVSIDDAKVVAKKIEEKFKKTSAVQKSQSEEVATQKQTPKRARSKGKFKPDDKATPATNEAWIDGKGPAPKAKPKKPKKPKMTVAK